MFPRGIDAAAGAWHGSPASTASMEFRTALFFLFLYYIRPQDWVQAISGVNIVRPMIVVWVAALMSGRSRQVLPGLLRTPHDWALLAYFGYIVWTSPDSYTDFKEFLPLAVFYVLTVRSLNSWERVLAYLKFWNWMMLAVALTAVVSLFGLDWTGARDATEGAFGRLCIGTYLHNNPNSLGHSVVPAIALSYLLYFWRGSAIGRAVLFPAIALLVGYCAYETESKGSFLVGAVLLVLVFVIGRPKPVQILALAAAATIGVGGLSFLPRMEKMGNLRGDAGVQGRLIAWEMARSVTKRDSDGVGWRQFIAVFPWEGEEVVKATHSSYVQVGADLGTNGLFLYVILLWLASHSLLAASRLTSADTDRERCRRAALLLVVAYALSGWMINREYHTEFFLLLAVSAAIHRLNLAEEREVYSVQAGAPEPEPGFLETASAQAILAGKALWNRIGAFDVGMGIALTWGVLAAWDYILKNL